MSAIRSYAKERVVMICLHIVPLIATALEARSATLPSIALMVSTEISHIGELNFEIYGIV